MNATPAPGDEIPTWKERMPAPRIEMQCSMNCSPRGGPCEECWPVTVHGDKVAARDAEIADLRAALAGRQPSESRNSAPWTDEQRANYRANRALVFRCPVCCVKTGEKHFPGCGNEDKSGLPG